MKKILKEDFQSDRLRTLVAKHGGIKATKHNDYFKRDNLEPSKITDDMMDNVQLCAPGDGNIISLMDRACQGHGFGILFRDGYFLFFDRYDPKFKDAITTKHKDREEARGFSDEDGKEKYQPINKKFDREFPEHRGEMKYMKKYGEHSLNWRIDHEGYNPYQEIDDDNNYGMYEGRKYHKVQITEQDITYMVNKCVRTILKENDFSNGLDRIRSSFYIKGKKQGLEGEELDNYVQEHFSDFMAKDAALNDFRSDLRKEHPNHEEDDEFYGHSIEMADAPGFADDFYYGDDE